MYPTLTATGDIPDVPLPHPPLHPKLWGQLRRRSVLLGQGAARQDLGGGHGARHAARPHRSPLREGGSHAHGTRRQKFLSKFVLDN